MALLFLSAGLGASPTVAAPKPATVQASKKNGAVRKKIRKRKKPTPRSKAPRSLFKKSKTNAAFLKRLPDWTWTVRGVIGLGALALLLSWRRKDRLASSPERDMRVVPRTTPAHGAHVHVPRAVVLNHAASPDPSTMMQDDTIDQWGAPKPAVEKSEDEQSAADLDAIVTSIHLQQNIGRNASVQPRRQTGLALPVDLSRHFEGQPGETLVWSAPFSVPMYASGTIAITSQRVLSLYRKQQWRFMPPGFEVQVRRHQMQRGRDLRAEMTTVRRPSFLVAAGLCVAWFPFGTSIAALAVALHLLAGRRELVLMHKSIRRLYPLDPTDIVAAIAACQPINTETQSTDEAAAPHQAI